MPSYFICRHTCNNDLIAGLYALMINRNTLLEYTSICIINLINLNLFKTNVCEKVRKGI